jgi:hypothetical protein
MLRKKGLFLVLFLNNKDSTSLTETIRYTLIKFLLSFLTKYMHLYQEMVRSNHKFL